MKLTNNQQSRNGLPGKTPVSLPRKWNQQAMAPYMFLAPFLILFLVFGLYPTGYSIFISFFDWRLSGMREFVGLENYTRLFTTDPFFPRALLVTGLLLIFGSLLQHVFAIPLAIALNNKTLIGREFFKTTYFLPYVTSAVAITLVFNMVFSHSATGAATGWINYVLENWFGIARIRWLSNPPAMIATLSIMLNWQFIGWNMVIYLAGLQSISKDLYEAAWIDGATPFQQHTRITLPLLLPVIFFATTLSIIGGMQLFDQPFILFDGYGGRGGPGNAGLTVAYYLMVQAFGGVGRFGRASAIAWMLFVFIIALTLLNKAGNKRLENR